MSFRYAGRSWDTHIRTQHKTSLFFCLSLSLDSVGVTVLFEDKYLETVRQIERVCRAETRCQTRYEAVCLSVHESPILIGRRREVSRRSWSAGVLRTPWRFSPNWTCMLARQIEELNIHTVPTLSPPHKGEFNYAWLPASLLSFLCLTRAAPYPFSLVLRAPLTEQLGQFYAYWYVNTDQADRSLLLVKRCNSIPHASHIAWR